MRGIAARPVLLLVLAALAFAAAASTGTAASPTRTPILGVVPHSAGPVLTPNAGSKPAVRTAARAAVPTTLTFDSAYETLLNRYFADVAHDSGLSNNVYSVATQYFDGSGHVQYSSAVGGSYVDKDPLPPNGCSDGGDTYCLTDQQLESEIQAVLTVKGWHGGPNHVFFLLTPNGVGSCFDAFGSQCSTNVFCAYHSAFLDSSDENVIYANEPYEGPTAASATGCAGPDQGFPNDTDADTTINTISHEHNEAITDPLGDAWLANDGSENGDLCAYGFGAALGGTGTGTYNQVINGHHYDLQQEYSNANGGCIQHTGGPSSPPTFGSGPLVDRGGPVMHTNTTYAIYWLPTAGSTSPPVVTGEVAVNHVLKTSAGSWTASPTAYSYQWQRCSSTGTGCVDIPGATAATYQLTAGDGGHIVRSTVRASNVNGASAFVSSATTAAGVVVDVPGLQKSPRISGRARVGKKLSGSRGSWTYSPTGYRYQWLRCNKHGRSCARIQHATHPTYKLTRRDRGHRLRLRVTATNVAGSAAALSAVGARVKH
jgi:hypothetical protein